MIYIINIILRLTHDRDAYLRVNIIKQCNGKTH